MQLNEQDKIFRSSALERLNSVDKLDTLVRVVPRQSWYALTGLSILIVTGLLWGWFGSIPTTVTSDGLIVRRAGLEAITSAANGRMVRLDVEVGDVVQSGDTIGHIAQPALELQLANAQSKLNELKARRTRTLELIASQNEIAEDSEKLHRQALEDKLAAAKEDAAANDELAKGRKSLLDRGLATRISYLQVYRDYTASRLQVAEVEGNLAEIDVQRYTRNRQNAREVSDLNQAVADAQREVDLLKQSIDDNEVVRSPFSGRVVEVATQVGDLVNPGDRIANIELEGPEMDKLYVLSFPNTNVGKQISEGMEARITPSTVKREEAGYLQGTVEYVSDYTVTRAAMINVLQSDALVDRLLQSGPPLEVRSALRVRDEDGGDLLWSANNGAQPEIESGTLAQIEVVTDRQRPLSLVVPWLKRFTGLD